MVAGLCILQVAQKINLFSALPFEILLSVLCYMIVDFECLQSVFLRPAGCKDGAICACSI